MQYVERIDDMTEDFEKIFGPHNDKDFVSVVMGALVGAIEFQAIEHAACARQICKTCANLATALAAVAAYKKRFGLEGVL